MKVAKRGRGLRRAKYERLAKIAWTTVLPRRSPREKKLHSTVSEQRRLRANDLTRCPP
jgi:hypothetical protein